MAEETMRDKKAINRWLVVAGAVLVQLALGSVYAFSIFTGPLAGTLGYKSTSTWILGIFATAITVFALTMAFTGWIQDRKGPRVVATIGGLVYAAGYLVASMYTDNIAMMYMTYGVIGGIGLGLAYVCPLAAAVKWFPDKKGLVSGIAVAGFGAGAFIFTQVGTFIIKEPTLGLDDSFLYLGLIFLAMVVGGAQLLVNPPEGWKPKGWDSTLATNGGGMARNYSRGEMLRTRSFVFLWLMFALAATAGLMMIGNVKNVAKFLDPTETTMVVAQFQTIAGILALFNAAGRIGWGSVSDRLGRTSTMKLMFLTQGIVLFGAAAFCAIQPSGEWIQFLGLTALASLVGFTFGGNFALFPSTTCDFFGTKNLGNNYGLVFTGYGAAAVIGALVPGFLAGSQAGFVWVFIAVGAGSLLAFGVAMATKAPKPEEASPACPAAS